MQEYPHPHLFAYTLIAMGAFLSAISWMVLFATRRGSNVSPIPLLGGLYLCCGLVLLPATRLFFWLAFLADYTCFTLIISLPRAIYADWSTSQRNLIHSFANNASEPAVSIKLFRRNIAVISMQYKPPVLCNDLGAGYAGFVHWGRWSSTENGFSIDGYCTERQLFISKQGQEYTTVEVNYPSSQKYKYDCLSGLTLQKFN